MIVTHASVFGHTNDTHIGLYDMALLGNIQNLVYLAPTNWEEYRAMLEWSIDQNKVPVAIRVPWTKVYHAEREVLKDYRETKYEIVTYGEKIAIIALGSFYSIGEDIVRLLKEEMNISATLINPRFITGLDEETLDNLFVSHELVVTLEDGILNGGFGAKIAQYYGLTDMKVMNKGFTMDIPTRYIPSEWMRENRLDVDQILEDIKTVIVNKNRRTV